MFKTGRAARESFDILCPICEQPQRTTGWLNWHLKNKHGRNLPHREYVRQEDSHEINRENESRILAYRKYHPIDKVNT